MGGMTELPASLVELARRYGVASEYQDWTGRHTTVADSTLIAVLDALGVAAATEDERRAALAAHDRDYWARSLPPTIVGRSGVASSFWVHVSHGDPAVLWIRLEDGSVRTGLRQLENNRAPYDLDGRLVGEATFELPGDLPLGYHQLHLQVGASDISTLVIVSPASMGLPARLGPSRAWGLATQLYSVRSQRSWGIGDLTDLADLAVWSASRHGAGFVLVNPLHAAAPTPPMEPSPYLPTSRRFINPLYLRVEAIAEFAYVRQRGSIRKARVEVAGPREEVQPDRPRRRVEGQAQSAGKRLSRRTVGGPGAGVHRLPRSGKGRASTTSPPGVRSPSSTGTTGTSGPRICSIRQPRGRRFRRRARQDRRLSPLAAVAARRPAHRRAGHGRPGGHGTRRHARSGGRRRSQRRRRVGAAGRAGARRHRGRTARRVQPARPGLVAAAMAARSTGGPRRTSRSAPWSTRYCGTRAAFASTTSSGCSGSGGFRRARCRPRAPTCATTTRR